MMPATVGVANHTRKPLQSSHVLAECGKLPEGCFQRVNGLARLFGFGTNLSDLGERKIGDLNVFSNFGERLLPPPSLLGLLAKRRDFCLECRHLANLLSNSREFSLCNLDALFVLIQMFA